jgi:hypothetical protein
MIGLKQTAARFPLTLVCGALFLVAIFGWWNSSRYSERHLVFLGGFTVEAFSASSLVRISFVNGHVGRVGRKTYYRQKNARGRMMLRPAYPEFRKRPDMIEAVFGYWHLAALAGAAAIAAGIAEARKRER